MASLLEITCETDPRSYHRALRLYEGKRDPCRCESAAEAPMTTARLRARSRAEQFGAAPSATFDRGRPAG